MLLAEWPSAVIAPLFTVSLEQLDAGRDFEGNRRCAPVEGGALADLANTYQLIIDADDGPTLLQALDQNPLVAYAYYDPLPVPLTVP